MNKFKANLTTQNKLILLGLVLSTILIVLIAFLATLNIQKKLNEGYQNFGRIISKTLAIESTEVIKDIPEFEKHDKLKDHSQTILDSNDDIAYIEFTSNNGDVIYTSKFDYSKRFQTSKISVSSPMIVKNAGKAESIGSVMVGLSGNIINHISSTARASLLFVFIVAWAVFAFVIMVNTYLITRELRILHHGVKKISSGEFGVKIQGQDVSSEVKELFEAFNDMSSRLRLYEEQNVAQSALEKNKLEAILMSIANGVVVCDNFDNIVLVNNQAQKILDVSEKELLNTKIQLYCDGDGELCFKEKIEKFKDTPLDIMEIKPLDFSIEINKKVVKAIMSPMFSKNSEYCGYIVVMIDITKETEMDKMRSQFISNVSHELRTPVTVLRSYIDTLYNFGEDFNYAEQKDFIGTMNDEIVRLNNLVNDILDFSRMDAVNMHLQKQYEDVVSVVEESIKEMEVLAKEKQITFSIIEEPDLPPVPLNHDSIKRVIKNLISNAIKYSPESGRIKVRAERARHGNFVEVSIEDQGPGIAPEYQSKVFDRFFRVENDTHTIKGTGLGLHLVKIAVEKHHEGEVFLQSTLGEGSTFGFRLPLNVVCNEDAEMEEEYVPSENLKQAVAEQMSASTQDSVKQTPPPENDIWEVSLEKREI